MSTISIFLNSIFILYLAATPSPRCADAAAATAVACFSSDTLVTLANQQQIPISQLRSGHQLLTTDGTKIVNTEMMMMLDQNQLSSGYILYIIIIHSIVCVFSNVSHNHHCIGTQNQSHWTSLDRYYH
jgi:hypothetical protein